VADAAADSSIAHTLRRGTPVGAGSIEIRTSTEHSAAS
jgi:hypothetical protein